MYKNLDRVTLLGIDGAGSNPWITKALHYSKRKLAFGKTILLSPSETYENIEGITLINIPKMSYEEWNRFTLKELHNYIDTEYYLFVDSDGFVLHPEAWSDEFLDYDYIGAAFWYPDHIFTPLVDESVKAIDKSKINLVGNGGFTLRSRKLLDVAKACTDTRYNPEDVYISLNNYNYFTSNGIKFAPKYIADKFALNTLHSDKNIFGFHGHKTHIATI